MNIDYRILDAVMAESIKRHGATTPMTLLHFRNILKTARRLQEKEEERMAQREEKEHHRLVDSLSFWGQS